MGKQVHWYANLLNRNFGADRFNQKWVTDISYIPTKQEFLYLSVIRDLYYDSIITRQQTVKLMLDTINDAMAKKGSWWTCPP